MSSCIFAAEADAPSVLVKADAQSSAVHICADVLSAQES